MSDPTVIRPWPEISALYRDLEIDGANAIADLCDYIDARPIRSGLHGFTSMHKLIIVQRPVSAPWEGPMLSVEPCEHGMIEFRLHDTQIKLRQWSRREPPDRIVARFKSTMRQLNWFTDPGSLD